MKIAFVGLSDMLATSLSNPFELFFAANQVAKRFDRRSPLEAELTIIADKPSPLSLASGLSLDANQIWDQQKEDFDLIYVPAIWRNPRPSLRQNPFLVDWLRRQHNSGAILNATGTGVCFLAETGLLDERPATTHWHYFDEFATTYPKVQLKRQHFITQAGRLFCAASINAQTDLTIHHIHRFYGQTVADHLGRHFSHEARQPFDQMSFNQDANTNHPDEAILQSQLWLSHHLSDTDVNFSKVAALFGMSQRNYSRRFLRATDQTPSQYLQSIRLKEARELLRRSNFSISEIAFRVGYLDASYFTQLFKRENGVTPKQYRTSVRAKLFNQDM